LALAAVGVAILAVAAYVVVADRPVDVAVPSPAADAAAACARLAAALPDSLVEGDRRKTSPPSELTAAWGGNPVVLRCGVGRPAGLQATSELTTVNGVDWFPLHLDHGVRFTTVGRVAGVEVTVPDTDAPEAGVLAELSYAVSKAVPVSPDGG
jgi:hypothetical protein